ncbi:MULTISPECIES: Fic family protein [Carboxydocella]|uniref:Fic family protein n=1 Tax=Carboxydocella TaxID=178898 RepID=UPI001FA82236|nr:MULTISPECIES: Fic family protein [Carboxydocella]
MKASGSKGVIQQLHRDLYKFSSIPGGRWKATDNSIVENRPDGSKLTCFQPVSAFMTPLAMEELCQAFNLEVAKAEIEPLVLTASFILDFLCIHPFNAFCDVPFFRMKIAKNIINNFFKHYHSVL